MENRRAERGRPRGFDRDAALEQAMRLFWRKTYEGTSLTELTAAMGISAPSLYAAFGSKDALFREAVAQYAERHGTEIWESLRDIPSVDAAVEGFLYETARSYSTPGDPPGCMIVLGTQHGDGEEDPVHRELRARRRAGLDLIAGRMTRAIADGELPASFDVGGAAAFLLSVQTGMSILARDGADRAALEAAARGGVLGWRGFKRMAS